MTTLREMSSHHGLEDLDLGNDLLEPEIYPDPSAIRIRLANTVTIHEQEITKKITSNKATLRALAPYLQLFTRSQKKMMESKVSKEAEVQKIPFEKKSTDIGQVPSIIPTVLDSPEIVESILETTEILKTLIRHNSFSIYFANPAENEIIQYSTKTRFKIEPGSTMAAYAAYTKHSVVSEDIHADQRFPLGIGIKDPLLKSGLCIPIKTPDEIVVALFELSRDDSDTNFNKDDQLAILTIASWIGVAALQQFKYTSLVRQLELKSYLRELLIHYHCEKISTKTAISHIVLFARDTIGAEECALYVVVGSRGGCLEVEEYAEGPKDSNLLLKKFSRIRLQHDNTVLSRVLLEKQKVNLKENSNVLCIPILCTCKNILAAIQLKNRSSRRNFDDEDEKYLQLFADHIALIIPFLREVKEVRKTYCQSEAICQILYHHIKPSFHERESIKRRCEQLHFPEHFFRFSWYPSTDDTSRLADLTINMFSAVLGESFMKTNDVHRFVLTVRNCYRPNAYHNFLHAFTVAHSMANIIIRNHNVFNGIERQALMVASLCHDLDHRGYNNIFVQLTKHYLSNLYESSPLENHHFAVTKMIIEQCHMFKHLRKYIYKQIIDEIYQCILATDLSLYFQARAELVKIADNKVFSFQLPEHRRLVKSLLMTACDLSGQSKPIEVAMELTKNVYEEFFQQGDVEKRMGFTPLSTMDRDNENSILDNQIHFLNMIVLPCVEIITRIFSSLHPLLEDTREILDKWTDLPLTDSSRNLFLQWKTFVKSRKSDTSASVTFSETSSDSLNNRLT